MRFVNKGPGATRTDLSAAEDFFLLALPRSYEELLIKMDGGQPRPDAFRYRRFNGKYTWDWSTEFLPLLASPRGKLTVRECRKQLLKQGFDPSLLIIATADNSFIAIKAFGVRYQEIFLIEMDGPSGPDAPVVRIAKSLDDFFNKLRPMPDR